MNRKSIVSVIVIRVNRTAAMASTATKDWDNLFDDLKPIWRDITGYDSDVSWILCKKWISADMPSCPECGHDHTSTCKAQEWKKRRYQEDLRPLLKQGALRGKLEFYYLIHSKKERHKWWREHEQSEPVNEPGPLPQEGDQAGEPLIQQCQEPQLT